MSAAKQRFPYHLVDVSPWPLTGSIAALVTTVGAVAYMHQFQLGGITLIFGLSMIIYTMIVWWRDVIREATYEGHHTIAVQTGIRYGIILFIVSEVMFFFSFFWAFFASSLVPTIEIGAVWPPKGIEVLDPFQVPLLNTFILLLSGCTVTWAHHAIVGNNRREAIVALICTIVLAFAFTALQVFEYIDASFTISDGIYGSTFYMATGFHGGHVLIGSIFLTVCLFRLLRYHFTRTHHVGFEGAAWYWHFVDVVWLFLFIMIYWWGGSTI